MVPKTRLPRNLTMPGGNHHSSGNVNQERIRNDLITKIVVLFVVTNVYFIIVKNTKISINTYYKKNE